MIGALRCDGSGGCTTRTSFESVPSWLIPVLSLVFVIGVYVLFWLIQYYRTLPKEDKGKAFEYFRGKLSSGLGLAPLGEKGLPPNNRPRTSRASSPSDPRFEGFLVYGIKGHGFDEMILHRGL